VFYGDMSKGGFADIPEVVRTGRAGHSVTHLTGSVFDLPSVERGALAYLKGQGLAGRAGLVPGSFFDGPPPPAGCCLLKYIIHDRDDSRARQILASCRDGMGADGVFLLIDRLLPGRFAGTPATAGRPAPA
jgi:hypothetical protein